MTVTDNTVVVGSDSSANNMYFNSDKTVALSDGNGKTLSTDSNIGVTTKTAPTEGTDVQFATSATEEMKKCFKLDDSSSGYVVKLKGDGLYIGLPTYDELWYKADNSGTKKFFKGSDSANLTETDITKFSDAVSKMSATGTIHMLSQYSSTTDEETNVPAGKNITVVRDNFTSDSMFSITGGTFTVKATDTTSSITFDGQKIGVRIGKGGAFYVKGGNIKLNGAEKTDGSKTIVIKDNTISSSYYAYGGGVYINGGTNTLENCSITGNAVTTSTTSTTSYTYAYGGGVYISGSATTTLENCSIISNMVSASSPSSYSRAIAYGGGVYISNGTNTLLGMMTVTDNTAIIGSESSTNNICFYNKTVALNDENGKTLNTDSNIGVTVPIALTSDTPVQFATDSTEEMKKCFTADNGGSEIIFEDGGLYLKFACNDLYYKDGDFYLNSACTNSVGITKFSDAVSRMASTGTIHMFSQYSSTTDEETNVPAGKNITVVRDSSFTNASMFSITRGTFTVNATDTSSSITFDGKKIETTVARGGAFYVEDTGSIKLNGAEKTDGTKTIVIKDNMVPNSSAIGGGICIAGSGISTLESCSITGNTAWLGGGVIFHEEEGTRTLSNCSVTNNTAYNGGGVHINYAVSTLEDCTITGNTATSASGGGIYIYESNSITLLGTMTVTDNTAEVGSDSSTNNNMYLRNGKTVALSDSSGKTLSTDSNIGVTTQTAPTEGTDVQFATSATEEMKACFTPDNDSYIVRYKDGGLYLCLGYSDLYYKDGNFYSDSACTSSTGMTKFSDAVSNIAPKGTIHMLSSYYPSADETVNVPAGKNITVVRDKSFKDASMFDIMRGTFTVNATNTTSSITFDGQKVETIVQRGGAFCVEGGTINLNGAEKTVNGQKEKTIVIKDNTASTGGGVCISSGTNNTLTNCSIKDNTASSDDALGGGVYINDGTNTLENCSITGNTVSSASSGAFGGGVCIWGGTNTLTNCSIKDNTASSTSSTASGGGVYIVYGTNTLLGTMTVTGNTAVVGSNSSTNNIYFNGETVALSDSSGKTLSTSSKIGVTTLNVPTEGNDVQFATNATEEMKDYFTPDNDSYIVSYKDGGLYLIKSAYSDLYYKNSNFYSDSACTNFTGMTKFSDAVSSMASNGTIHMLSSYAVSSGSETAVVPTDRNINIVRDSSFSTGIMFNISGGSLAIKVPDTTKTKLTISGEDIDVGSQQGGAFTVSGSGSLTLEGASSSNRNLVITKHKADNCAMNLDSGSCLMKNCFFTENTATSTSGGGGIGILDCKTIFDGCKISGNRCNGDGSSYYLPQAGILVGRDGTTTLVGDMEVIDNYNIYDNSQANLCILFSGTSPTEYYSIALSYTDSNGVNHKLTSGQGKIGTCSISILGATRIFATGANSDMVKCFVHDYNSSYQFKIDGTNIYMHV